MGALVDLCRVNPQACSATVQDMATARKELQQREGYHMSIDQTRVESALLDETMVKGVAEGRAEGLVEGRVQSWAQGRVEGEYQKSLKMACRLKEQGMDAIKRAQRTGLDVSGVGGLWPGGAWVDS